MQLFSNLIRHASLTYLIKYAIMIQETKTREGDPMSIVNPSQARKIFYQLLKDVNETHEPIYISGKKEESEAVIVSKKDWDAILETLYLQSSGVADIIHQREKEREFVALEDIDWDTL